MKLGIIAHSHFPIAEPFVGGMETHTYYLTKNLISKGHDVTLYCAEGSDNDLNIKTFCKPTHKEKFDPCPKIIQYREECYNKLMS